MKIYQHSVAYSINGATATDTVLPAAKKLTDGAIMRRLARCLKVDLCSIVLVGDPTITTIEVI
jgi:hypothetical protein